MRAELAASRSRCADDLTRGRVRLLDDDHRLILRGIAELGRRSLGRDQRLAKQRLELAVADDVLFELLDLVDQIGALAPDLFEAVGDLEQQPLGGRTPVAA